MPESAKPVLELIQYTDPYCTWCWGIEPVMRHIEEVYGSQVQLGFIMGGLVEDTKAFKDPLNKIGGPEFPRQVADHWREASTRHGMPVDADVWLDMKDEFRSTWPANIAFKAAEMQDRQKANRFLRRLRQAAAAEHRFIHRREVQAELAAEAGLDVDRLLAAIDSGAAGEAFKRDLEACREAEVTGFPSFRVRESGGEEFMFFGYQPFPRFVEIFERLAGDRVKPREIITSEENILDFIRRHGKVAWREIGEVFSLNRSQVNDWMERLQGRGLVTAKPAGNGWFHEATGQKSGGDEDGHAMGDRF